MSDSGREDKYENDLFFVCSLIESIGRTTKNKRGKIVRALGEEEISRLLEAADILHCEPVEATADGLIKKYALTEGDFDNIALCEYTVPTCFDMGKVYKRLISSVSKDQNISFAEALIQVYTSWICDKIDDYNSSMYYENPQYLHECYKAGRVLED